MVFFKLFQICTFKDINLAKNWTNLVEKSFKKTISAELVELHFCNSAYTEVGFSLESVFKKIVLTPKLVLVLNWDTQK